jgi:hypothetical protein
MYSKQAEIGLINPSQRNGRKGVRHDVTRHSTESTSAQANGPLQVVDEAFAALGDQLARVDKVIDACDVRPSAPSKADGADGNVRSNKAIVSEIVAQLEALDRQRQRLTKLLASTSAFSG